MRDAAMEALSFAKDRKREDVDRDRMLLHSLVRCIEIVGEAAAGVSDWCRETHPDIAWPDIVAMRNRLIHGYFDIDADRVWDTVQDDLPPLVNALNMILGK